MISSNDDLVGIYMSGGGIEGMIRALREENAGCRIVAVCNELMPITRSALIDGTIDMVMATPAALLASHAVDAMARASNSERPENKNIIQLQAEIYVSENI
jgi:LacI family transcriptional regulator